MHKLIIQDDEGKTTVVPLIRDEITIGRKEGNTIRLTERNVSRRHARIVKANGSVVVEDLDSYNGVKVNGTRIQGRVPVNESDRIQIGDYLLELKVERGAPAGDPYASGQGSGQYGPMSGPGMAAAAPAPVPMSMQPTPALGMMGMNGGARAAAGKAAAPMPMPGYDQQQHTPPPQMPAPDLYAGGAAAQPGRLVIVSSNFPGREFILDKAVMVIGRTDENDIVVNHRSISRHHAKIVLEQGRYCIVDMQSSNGVRVNGEEYGKVELRRGDMIDLGHVRMRYVEPGEDFVFDRDATLIDVKVAPRKGKGGLVAGLSVLVLGAVVAVVFVTQSGDGEAPAVAAVASPTEEAPVVAAREEPTSPPVAVTVDAATAAAAVVAAEAKPAEPPPPDPAEDTSRLVAEAREAVAAEKWVAALAAAEQVLKLDAGHAEAKKIQDDANAEFRNQTTYEQLVRARSAGTARAADVVRLAREIPENSVYRARAVSDLETVRDAYTKEREAEARAFAARGQCDRITRLARTSGDLFPETRAAVERVGAGCAPVVAARPPPPEPAEPRHVASSSPSEAELQALVSDAKEAARNNNWADARKKADEVLRFRPNDQDALSVGGIAACNLLDPERASRYIGRLRGHRQTMMKQICASKGLTIE